MDSQATPRLPLTFTPEGPARPLLDPQSGPSGWVRLVSGYVSGSCIWLSGHNASETAILAQVGVAEDDANDLQ